MPMLPGRRIGPYEILSAIGAGGMGEVYKARDTRLNRDVALKILPESFANDAERLRRFEQETQAVAALNHPNILAIYDVGTRDNSPFLVSELLDGESLRTLLDRGPTASYMAPEQVRGGPIDARTDMFSFGVVLYEMLSGKRAFHRDSAPEIMTAILREDIPEFDAGATATPVSPALERIVRRCLEKSPEQRFQSAKDLAFALEAVSQISGAKTGAQPIAATAEPRRKSQVPIYAGALVFAAAMLGLGWWLGHRKPPASPEYRQFTFRAGFMGNARFAPDGSVIYSATWEGSNSQLYIAPVDSLGERELPFKNVEILSVSSKGELAVRLNSTIRS